MDNKSQCFEHDIGVRNAWKSFVNTTTAARMAAIAQKERFQLYRDLDTDVKHAYLESLRTLNKELVVVHVKGLGPVRKSTKQVDLEVLLYEAAESVMQDYMSE